MKLNEVSWVIVQAGGKGTRLEHLTLNKPKCLVSIAGKPLLYHLFDRFPQANFIVIGDHLYEVMEKYLLAVPPEVSVKLIKAQGKGTLGGVKEALTLLPGDNIPFLLVWSDLLLEKVPDVEINEQNLIGLSRSFRCRWSYSESNICQEEPSSERGIAGFFLFQDRQSLGDVPEGGECVRTLAEKGIPFDVVFLDDVYEIGTLDALSKYQSDRAVSRFFNEVTIQEDRVIKRSRIPEFAHLIEKELNWYRTAHSLNFQRLPQLIAENPMTLSRINGVHPFELNAEKPQNQLILQDIFQQLDTLHSLGQVSADETVIRDVYLEKTISRVQSVAKLIPHINEPIIKVNDRLCRNPFHEKHQEWLKELSEQLTRDKFVLIHGDPTFSNTLVDKHNQAWFIDPRGYFGSSLLYGDPIYDWAKLYYSVVGDYDTFNRRCFQLRLINGEVTIEIQSNDWGDLEPMFQEKFPQQMPLIRIAHALIWISLCGYVTDDYDSILGAFYNGLLWLEKAVE